MSTNNTKKYFTLLKFKLHNEGDIVPEFSVYLNGIPLRIDSNTASGHTGIGPNTLTIAFTNKQHYHHHLALELEALTVDDIDLTHDIKSNGKYITDDGDQETTYGYMHKNGTLTFEFLCPVFYYLRNKNLIKNQEYAALQR